MTIDPSHLDFGSVVVGSKATRAVAIANHCGGDATVVVGDLQGGGDTTLFTFTPPLESPFTLKDGESHSLALDYQPTQASTSQSQAYLYLSLCRTRSDCSVQVVLQGQPVATGLSAAPDLLTFGFVTLNQSVTQSFTLTNSASRTIHLVPSILDLADGGAPGGMFQLGAGAPSPGAALLPGESVQVPVAFTPTSAARFLSELDVSTDDLGSPILRLPLVGYGGGPRISCAPTSLDFGSNALGIGSKLSILCSNVGVDVPGHPEANLIFPDPSAVPPGVPFQNDDPAFKASFALPVMGLAVGQSAQIDVSYSPSVAGTSDDTLKIASNDASSPVPAIALTGLALALPACSYQLVPSTTLAFGRVTSQTVAVSSIEIRNLGTDSCLVKNPHLEAGSAKEFSLPDYSQGVINNDFLLPPGYGLLIDVQFAPTTESAGFTGSVSFGISDPANPTVTISLTGSSLPGCLVIQPSPIDLGTVGYDSATSTYCSSGLRTVTLRNACDTEDVLVDTIELRGPGASKFVLTHGSLPVTIPKLCGSSYCPPRTPMTFQVAFSPNVSEVELGGISISTSDSSDPYLTPLRGEATQDNAWSDAFTAHAPKLDLLWVIDTGPAVDVGAQQAIAANLSSFLAYPDQAGLDLNMTVTSTDVFSYANSEDGRMEPCSGCKVDGVAMTVVTLANGLQSAVDTLGPLISLGSGVYCTSNCNGFAGENQFLEATYEALSPALLAGHNQPFYRQDAALAVIVVAGSGEDDKSDQQPTTFYYDAFLELKGLAHADQFTFSRVNKFAGIGSSQRLSQMVQLTGGVEADLGNIGTPAWIDELNGLWTKIGDRLIEYPLSGTPVPSSISVSDNGTPIPSTSWTYDSTNNGIRFTATATPPAGDQIVVNYTLTCGN